MVQDLRKGKPLSLTSEVDSSRFSPTRNTSNSVLVSLLRVLCTLNIKSFSPPSSPLKPCHNPFYNQETYPITSILPKHINMEITNHYLQSMITYFGIIYFKKIRQKLFNDAILTKLVKLWDIDAKIQSDSTAVKLTNNVNDKQILGEYRRVIVTVLKWRKKKALRLGDTRKREDSPLN